MVAGRGFAGLSRRGYRALGAAVLTLGLPVLVLATTLTGWTVAWSLGTLPTSGTVVDLQRDDSTDGTTYRPIVEYTVAGVRYRITGAVSWSPSMSTVGATVRVLYAPDRPEKAIIDAFLDRWSFPGVLLLTSLAVCAFAVLIFRGNSLSTGHSDTPPRP